MSHSVTRSSRTRSRALGIALGVVLALALPAQALANDTNSGGEGVYTIQVPSGGAWITIGTASFGRQYETRSLSLTGDYDRVRLVQSGGTAAQVDSVSLGGGAPAAVSGSPDALALKKLATADLDVVNVFDEAIVVTFPHAASELEIRARIQGDLSDAYPFEYPVENTYKPVTADSSFYTYRTGLGASVIDTDAEPFARVFSKPGTGHPEGYTYLWVADNDAGLQVTLDFTSDNTMDADEDYATVHVKTPAGVRDFTVSAAGSEWGSVAFTYTNKVNYQHKLYTFAIPWSEIGGRTQTVDLSFTAYGTAAITPVPLPVHRFYNSRTGAHFYTTSDDEKASVIAHPEWGFVSEGVAYIIDSAHPSSSRPLHRFYNSRTGAHFYTASDDEKASVIAHPEWGFAYEGVAYMVAADWLKPVPVYRFYNRLNGVHFYTADEAEKNLVISKLGHVYTLEGIGFYIVPYVPMPFT